MSTPTNPTKKTRALPRVWARFLSLKASDTFTHQGRRYYKSVLPLTAINQESGAHVFFTPWTRVQTDVRVRKSNIRGTQISKEEKAKPVEIHPAYWETSGGTTPEQNEAREFPKQPNSDNQRPHLLSHE